MRMIPFCVLTVLVLSPVTGAQDRTVALTSTTQYLVGQEMDGQNCKSVRCGLNFEKAAAANAGGTAYDARSGIVWVSNGLALAAYYSPDGSAAACKQACSAIKIPQPLSTVLSYCTGLAYLEAGVPPSSGGLGPYGRLYILYSTNYIGVADVKGCALGNIQFCSIANSIGNANVTGGLACDDINRRLFVGTYDASAGALAYVFDADKVCSVICKFQLLVSRLACGSATQPLKAMTGLAYNGCSRMLYATDGSQTIWGLVTVSPTGGCTFTHRACCPVNTEAYTGLALLPAPQQHLGKQCSVKVCNSCTPQVSTTGDAVLGNKLFAINMTGAPSNTTAYALAIGIGSCSLPGLNLGFCQPVMISTSFPGPFVFIFGTAAIAGTCNRNVSFPLPIPVNPKLCNLTISFQWLAACQGNPVGNSMTDCLTVQLGSL